MVFEEYEFPLCGILAEQLVIFEWIIAFLFLQFALIFYNKAISNKNNLKGLQEKGYFSLFLSFSLMCIFFVFGDFYVANIYRELFLNLGYISMMIGTMVFIFIIETHIKFIIKYCFSFLFLFDMILFISFLIFLPDLTQVITFTFWLVFIIFFVFYTKELQSIFKFNPALGKFMIQRLTLTLGISLIVVGFALTTDFMILNFGLYWRLFGDILQLISLLFLFIFFLKVPSFAEYNWQDKIEGIFIIHKSGLLLYQRSFKKDEELLYEPHKSGILTTLKIMLDNIGNKEDYSIIEKDGRFIMIQPGKNIHGVLISNKKLDSLMTLLNNSVYKIELIYSGVLEDWNGDLEIFKPLDEIVKECFY